MAWLSQDWQYRNEITVDNSSNSNVLSNYQVKVSLDSTNFDFSLANSDGSDIRFTDSDGTTLIDFWIESWDATGQTATLWAKVPSIAASSTATIYMYYGNSGASSASNIRDTAIIGDDFSGINIDTNYWSVEKKGSSNAVAELDGSGHLHLVGEHGVVSSANVISQNTVSNNFAIRIRRSYSDAHYVDVSIGNGVLQDLSNGGTSDWWHTCQGDGYSFVQQRLSNHYIAKAPSGAADTVLVKDNSNSWGATSTYETDECRYLDDGTLSYYYNGTQKLNASDTDYVSTSKYVAISQGEYSNGDGGDQYVDFIFVRQYTSPEPSTSVGIFSAAKWISVIETPVVSLTRITSLKRLISIIETPIVSLIKTTSFKRLISVVETPIVSLKKGFSKIISVIETPVVSLSVVKAFFKTISVIETPVVNLSKRVSFKRLISVIETPIVSLVKSRKFFRLISVVETPIVSLTKRASFKRLISVIETPIVNLSKKGWWRTIKHTASWSNITKHISTWTFKNKN